MVTIMSSGYDLDKRVKCFYITTKRQDGFIVNVKKYIHPEISLLHAKFQNLKSDQIIANKQAQNETTAYFIMNRRVLRNGWYIEFERRNFGICTYQILGVDPFDDTSSYLKISVKEINSALPYDSVEYTEVK